MNKKVELVLNGLIEIYLHELKPLSSTKLKEFANLPYSASSIRSYLKELEKNELIEKEHFSSGSYPSVKAMKSFWCRHLQQREIDINKLEKADELDIYVMIEMFENQMLVDVYNLNNRFIILEFENDEIVLKYNTHLYSFFNSVKGILLDELKKYLLHIGLYKEYQKLKSLYEYRALNRAFIYKNGLNSEIFENFDFSKFPKGLSFEDEYLFFKNVINKQNRFFNILLVGSVYTNFFDITQERRGSDE